MSLIPSIGIEPSHRAAYRLSRRILDSGRVRLAGGGEDQRQQPWSDEAQVVVVCTCYQVKSFAPLSHLPLTPVRGQTAMLPVTPHSENMWTIVSANGYLAPSAGELHVLGATHGFDEEAVDLRTSDHAENLSKLADISPALTKLMNIDSLDVEQLNGRASVRASVPRVMLLVGELLPGVYTSLGHGTRGLITAGLSGELIAAMACGQLLPLPSAVVNALTPVPGLVR